MTTMGAQITVRVADACPHCGNDPGWPEGQSDLGVWQGIVFGLLAVAAVTASVALTALAALATLPVTADVAARLAEPLRALPGVADPLRAATVGAPVPLAALALCTAFLVRRRGVWIGLFVVFAGVAVALAMTAPSSVAAAS